MPGFVRSYVLLAACALLCACDPFGGDGAASPTPGPSAEPALPTSDEATCAPGTKSCFGVCKAIDDPSVGCSATDCTSCEPLNAEGAMCKGTGAGFACGFDRCAAGFQDCDGSPANGCETSRNDSKNCGACGTVCTPTTPFCAWTGGAFGCVGACPEGTLLCSGACVTVASDVANCGGCGKACAKPGATATCANGTCAFACNASQGTTKDCGAQCVSPSDPAFCQNCQPCPTRPNTTVSCSSGQCSYRCAAGWYDCDGSQQNGCESRSMCWGGGGGGHW